MSGRAEGRGLRSSALNLPLRRHEPCTLSVDGLDIKRTAMKISLPVQVKNLALVAMAAGVVTASPEFTLEAAGEFTPIRLSDILSGSGEPGLGHPPIART